MGQTSFSGRAPEQGCGLQLTWLLSAVGAQLFVGAPDADRSNGSRDDVAAPLDQDGQVAGPQGLGYVQIDPRGAELLFLIITEREERASVPIAINLPFSKAPLFARTCVRRGRS